MEITRFITIAIMFMASIITWAVPAKPGFTIFKQSDGSTVSVETIGDEFFSCFVTSDGLTVDRASNGDWYYTTDEGLTAVMAHDVALRSAAEKAFVEQLQSKLEPAGQMSETTRQLIRRVEEMRKVSQVPNNGNVKIPILLVQYKDLAMQHTKAEFQQHYTLAAKSAYKYFYDQSNGKFRPQFDLYGIYTLSGKRATYGAHGTYTNGSTAKDVGKGAMVAEAIKLAQAEGKIKWSSYDNDGDAVCDVVIVVYAGVGESQASTTHPEAVWPAQWSLSSAKSYGDGPGTLKYDNTTMNKFAVFCEIKGPEDNGGRLDGIGTFCHEFSHCLGIRDFYDTEVSRRHYGMGRWSIMCSGCYNDNGYTPAGYSAYEKNSLGWLSLKTPVANTKYTLTPMNLGSESTDQALKIVSSLNQNEYFVLENRRKQGWDEYLGGEGLLIHHITYNESKFSSNKVNTEDIQLVTIVPADGIASEDTESGDTWGYRQRNFTNTSSPAATLNMTSRGSITGSAGYLGKAVNDIEVNEDGTVSLYYINKYTTQAPTLSPTDNSDIYFHKFKAGWTHSTPRDVTSYKLWVHKTEPASLLEKVSFSGSGTISSNGNLTDATDVVRNYTPDGWTTSGHVYITNDHLMLNGSDIITRPYDLSAYDEVTVKITGRIFNSSYTPATVTIKTSTDSKTLEFTGTSGVTKTAFVTIKGGPGEKIYIGGANKVLIHDIEIDGGRAAESLHAPLKAPAEAGDSTSRVITGITDMNYWIDNLQGGGNYRYKVKAVYPNGSESDWSNVLQAQLALNPEEMFLTLDVNQDGNIDIEDINMIIDNILSDNGPALRRADVNNDGEIDVADINTIIEYLMR